MNSSLRSGAAARPCRISMIRSTPASALGRCATTITIPAARPHAQDGARERLVTLRRRDWELGSSSTTGTDAVKRRARARFRCRWPAESTPPLSPDLGIVAIRQTQDHLMHARGFGRRDHVHLLLPARRSGRCSAPPCRQSSTSCGRWPICAPSAGRRPLIERRTIKPQPCAHGDHTPTSARERHDLPLALGPTMPSAFPFSSRNERPAPPAGCPRGGTRLRSSPKGLPPASAMPSARRHPGARKQHMRRCQLWRKMHEAAPIGDREHRPVRAHARKGSSRR